MPNIDVLIVAAGSGTRLGSDVPKQFMPLAGKSMLERVIGIYRAHPAIRNVQVVIGEGQEAYYHQALPFSLEGEGAPQGRMRGVAAAANFEFQNPSQPLPPSSPASPDLLPQGRRVNRLLPVVVGGPRRQDSVRLGLEAIAADAPDYVLIVDAARPFTSPDIIDRIISNLGEAALLTAIPLADSLKRQDEHRAVTIDRSKLFLAQTPQAFPFATILKLHQKLQDQDFTDDVALFEAAGLPIQIIQGDTRNFKITTPEDFAMAEALLNAQSETRIGHGFDVHRFKDGDHAWLGGIRIPHTQGVDAHSDGDVILHALTDALLGAIGKGDIGQHFPPSDPQWKDAASDQFVRHAMTYLTAANASVINADITVLAEAPKIGPHRDAIRQRIAELLNIDNSRVNVKATTTEKLGYIGRAEGLAAEAVVMVRING